MNDLFQHFEIWGRAYGYPILFFGVMLENAGIPVPGETAVLAFGFLANTGWFDIRMVIAVAVCGAILGDNCGFLLGHFFARPWLRRGQRFLFLTPRALELTERYFARYGMWTILFARFVTGIRVVGALAAGAAGMSWRRFLVANALGAVLWATCIALIGCFFGAHWHRIERLIGRAGLIALACIVLIILHFIRRNLQPRPPLPGPVESPPRPPLLETPPDARGS